MSAATRQKYSLYLLGASESEIRGSKLPSNSQILKVFFYYHVNLKQTIRKASTAAVEAAIPFWARIPISAKKHLITKVEKLHEKWKTLKKTRNPQGEKQRHGEARFLKYLDNLFDMAAQDALQVVKIEEDKQFHLAQREEGRRGSMGGVDKTLADKEKRAKKRKSSQENYNITLEQPGPSHVDRNQIKFSSTSGEDTDEEYFPVSDSKPSNPKKPRPTEKAKNIMTSGLAAALDCIGVSDRNAVYILSEALLV